MVMRRLSGKKPDLEQVVLIPTDGERIVFEEDTPVLAYTFLMRRVDGGWLVAGMMSDQPPTAAWPPAPYD